MTALPRRLRLVLRAAEALVLSVLAGAFVWLLASVVYLPLVFSAFLGFLCGGTATLRTLGVVFPGRRGRMVLASTCALVGYATYHGIEYLRFARYQRHRQQIADYTASDGVADRRVAAELRALTGRAGPAGYFLSALGLGVRYGPLRLRGAGLLLYWVAEAGLAVAVAARWAGGPPPPLAARS